MTLLCSLQHNMLAAEGNVSAADKTTFLDQAQFGVRNLMPELMAAINTHVEAIVRPVDLKDAFSLSDVSDVRSKQIKKKKRRKKEKEEEEERKEEEREEEEEERRRGDDE